MPPVEAALLPDVAVEVVLRCLTVPPPDPPPPPPARGDTVREGDLPPAPTFVALAGAGMLMYLSPKR